jgi:hypothetical protein
LRPSGRGGLQFGGCERSNLARRQPRRARLPSVTPATWTSGTVMFNPSRFWSFDGRRQALSEGPRLAEERGDAPKYLLPVDGAIVSLSAETKAPSRIIYVVESAFSVMRFHQLGVAVVALLGWSAAETKRRSSASLPKAWCSCRTATGIRGYAAFRRSRAALLGDDAGNVGGRRCLRTLRPRAHQSADLATCWLDHFLTW